MNLQKFKGIFPALLTPFDKDNKIDEKALTRLIEWNLEKGVSGFYVNGSTAEVFMLSDSERIRLYHLVSEICRGRCTLIAHIGAISTDQTIAYGKIAEKCGYDAISSVAPFYYKFSFEEIKNHYFSVVNQVNLPMIIYNFPVFSGVSLLSADNIALFLSDDRFIGVKHTSSDFFAMEQFKSAFPEKLVYNGYDEMFLAGLAMGADGGIGSTYNFMAEKFIKIQALFKENKMGEALKVQHTANKIIAALCKIGVQRGEKAILNLLGYNFGNARAPFLPLTSADYDFVKENIIPLL
ncbi:MAG: N-acetylneuraminate lyase [Acutalibacteraceae bacterium]|jgi:N-acetylneuraminate lyase